MSLNLPAYFLNYRGEEVEDEITLDGEFAWIVPAARCAFTHTDGRQHPGTVVRVENTGNDDNKNNKHAYAYAYAK
jgi:hypothetical protein